jgi:hypothetical protein
LERSEGMRRAVYGSCEDVVVWMNSVSLFTPGDVVRKEQINKYGSMKVVL